MKKLFTTFMFLTVLPCMAFSAEVKNLKVAQEGDKAVAIYDLVSSSGEQDAEVTAAINVNGQRRTSDKMHLTGDFGKGVKVGKGKRIVWNATADLPADFDGDINWDVKTVRAVNDKGDETSLEDTMDWLRRKISAIVVKTDFPNGNETKHSTFEYSMESNDCDAKMTEKEIGKDIWSTNTFTRYIDINNECVTNFSMKDITDINIDKSNEVKSHVILIGINVQNISACHYGTSGKMEFTDGRPDKIISNDDPPVEKVSKTSTLIQLNSLDNNLADRIVKAFKHAKDLCGTRKEAF